MEDEKEGKEKKRTKKKEREKRCMETKQMGGRNDGVPSNVCLILGFSWFLRLGGGAVYRVLFC